MTTTNANSALRPTLKSVADLAGVCTMTVSLALRNSTKITEETRIRIQDIAARVGYKPNPFATSLVSLRSTRKCDPSFQGTLALLNCGATEKGWQRSPTFCRMMRGAREAASSFGYCLDEFWFNNPEVSAARMRQTLISRGIHGVMFAFFDQPGTMLEKLRQFDFSGFASITISRKLDTPRLHSVSSDQYYAAMAATRKLIDCGYRRIGLVVNEWVDAGLEHRFRAGFLASQAALPKHDHVPVFEAPEAFPSSLLSWIKLHRVEAIVTLPCTLQPWLHHAGYAIPKDIAVACLDVLVPGDGLTGIDQKSELVGSAAVEEVVAQIHRNQWGVPRYQKTLYIQGEWTGDAMPSSYAPSPAAQGSRVPATIPS
jgi:LacI family transcriptional regulator